jgi:succinate dehydrogenase / fumarate reductase, cytochrome b subunit
MAATQPRPTSPHWTIWRWGPGMAASIIHRISGVGLAIVGLAILTWWLSSIATGADAYAKFAKFSASWPGMVILIGLTWAFFQHLLSGIRHLAMDTGQGFELRTSKTSALLTFIGAVVLTAALWAYLLGVVK